MDSPSVGAVEFGENDILPGTEIQLAVFHRYRDSQADDYGAEVRISILAVAIGDQWIVVLVVDTARNDLLEEGSDVGE